MSTSVREDKVDRCGLFRAWGMGVVRKGLPKGRSLN